MPAPVKTVAEYLMALPADRRAILSAVREVIRANLDDDYQEGIQYGMIGYYVPHRRYPAGYHTDPKQPLPFAALASQKNYLSLYLMGTYCGCADGEEGETADASWFRRAWTATGKKLDMGKSCIRFKKLEDIPLEVVGEAIRRLPARKYIARYQAALAMGVKGKAKGKARKSPR